jgi:hypothetical protein
MKMNALHTVFILGAVCFGQVTFSQGGLAFEPEASIITSIKPAAPATKPTSVRFHKRFPQLFTGFAIEIAASTYPMDRANPIFQQFGNVLYDKLDEGGYSYLIMANFSSKDAALEFVNKVVKPKAEHAKLIHYNEGNRKVIRE